MICYESQTSDSVEYSEEYEREFGDGLSDEFRRSPIPEGYGEVHEKEPDYEGDDDATNFKRRPTKLLATAFADDSEGSFAGYGSLNNAPNPGIYIEGVGSIGSPLSQHDAEKIIQHSQQAPFGKKEKTIVDVSVRRTWQIDASRIQFQNPKWTSYVKTQIIPRVAEKLGLDKEQIDAHLYKLLLYGEGGHFKAHQDTEKEPGMFGTLIIVLPSPYTGGNVTATHRSQEMTFDTAADSAFGTSFTCIYSDVFHKVHPVTSGYRFVLSYNLIFKDSNVRKPIAPEPNNPMLELREFFEKWPEDLEEGKEIPKFIAHVLEHHYSRVGLDFDCMKGRDRTKVNFLKDIAKEFHYSIYVAQIDIILVGRNNMDNETGNPIYDYAMEELDEREYKLKEGVDPDGKEINVSNMEIDKFDACPPLHVGSWKADHKNHEGYTGNEGADVTHYYYRTTLLMWPKSQDNLMSLKTAGVKLASMLLKKRAAEVNSNVEGEPSAENLENAPTSDRNWLRTLTDIMVELYFHPNERPSRWGSTSDSIDAIAAASLALHDKKLYLQAVRFPEAYLIGVTNWIGGIRSFGFSLLQEHLEKMLIRYRDSGGSHRSPAWFCNFYQDIIDAFPKSRGIKPWAEQGLNKYMLKISTLKGDGDSVKFLLKRIRRVGFSNCQETLSSIFQSVEKNLSKTYWREYDDKTISEIVKIFKGVIHDDTAIKWICDKLARVLHICVPLRRAENVQRQYSNLVQFCLDQKLPYIPILLGTLQQSPETEEYLVQFIQPFAALLKSKLDKRSLSYNDPPFKSFASHFIKAGISILRKPPPTLPGDYSLPPINNRHIDHFLKSSIQHAIIMRDTDLKCSINLGALANALQTGFKDKLSVEYFDSSSTLFIRKAQSTARQGVLIKYLLSPDTQEEWQDAYCPFRRAEHRCACCARIETYLHWCAGRQKAEDFLRSFGNTGSVKTILDTDTSIAIDPQHKKISPLLSSNTIAAPSQATAKPSGEAKRKQSADGPANWTDKTRKKSRH